MTVETPSVEGGASWRAAIDQLYDAVGREQRLAQALGEFRPFFVAQGASFITAADAARPNSSHTGAAGISDQLLVEYHAHTGVHDEWVLAAQRRSDFGRLFVAVSRRWQAMSNWLPEPGGDEQHALRLDLMSEDQHAATLQMLPIQAALADTVAQHPAVAMITLNAGARDRSQALRDAYGLSAAEVRVAEQLTQGRSAADIAAAGKVAVSTVRSHMASLRAKMGVSRQAQIVSAVLAL